ncbi:MAG: DUF2892 domain-containing protein [Sphingobacteriia bacterium]|nr:MAG: DUF2892 domain-containing protein [Sphingobacteriia bacterium]
MQTERIIRAVAGTIVLASIALAHYVHPQWIWVGVFVGLNLLQSSISCFCPLESLLTQGKKNKQTGAPTCKI